MRGLIFLYEKTKRALSVSLSLSLPYVRAQREIDHIEARKQALIRNPTMLAL